MRKDNKAAAVVVTSRRDWITLLVGLTISGMAVGAASVICVSCLNPAFSLTP